ncbi:MAG: diacylglycerol kinase family protein [Propionicimonas sp.]
MSSQPGAWAVVVNRSKFDDLTAAEAKVDQACRDHGWPEPRWYETTIEDPGTGQTHRAIAEGAGLVCPLGGDGTVRAVAEGLAGTGIPMGLLPGGTGNLLARNLKLPVDDLDAALTAALTGRNHPVDVGLVGFDDDEPVTFLVMAGMGLDADAVGGASTALKKRIGWLAYALSGAKALVKVGFSVRVDAGAQRALSQHAATVLVGNCGELTGGLRLMPEAKVDDGQLDAVVVSPRSISAWFAVGLYVLTRHRRGHTALVHLSGPQITAVTRKPILAQLDGDVVGPRSRLDCTVRPGALLVRLPEGTA